jgi:hypothetical protein
LWQDKILLFDCIEFNEQFRFVDVMYDVAFTVMDLESRGRRDLGNAFLNTYIEQTGDWEGLQLLPLYLSRQAYVRAKVTSLMLDDPLFQLPKKQRFHRLPLIIINWLGNTQNRAGKVNFDVWFVWFWQEYSSSIFGSPHWGNSHSIRCCSQTFRRNSFK